MILEYIIILLLIVGTIGALWWIFKKEPVIEERAILAERDNLIDEQSIAQSDMEATNKVTETALKEVSMSIDTVNEKLVDAAAKSRAAEEALKKVRESTLKGGTLEVEKALKEQGYELHDF